MSIHSLQLLEIPGNYKTGTLPYGPRAYIALESYGSIELPNESGKRKVTFHTLSPDCVMLSEIEYEIDRFIRELQTIRKQAKKFFQKEKEREKGYLTKR